MPIDYEKLINFQIPDVRQSRTTRDTMLYALSLGLGGDPTDSQELQYVFEKDLVGLPTMAVVLCAPHAWLRQSGTGVGNKIVHGGQRLTIHTKLPVEGDLLGVSKVKSVIDKGVGKGALVVTERKVYSEHTGELVASLESTSFCRGDGGFGGPSGPVESPHEMPAREPDIVDERAIPLQAALIYRLNGDRNPLHADPEVARKAGFPRPILHGLCTFGYAGVALLRHCCHYDASQLKSMETRFSAPIMPGETLRTEIWRDGNLVSFRALAMRERDAVVLDNGRAELVS
jgi:acyl dehydratase